MKKFIAPEVKVVRYDSSILCGSISIGDDEVGTGETIEFDAPRRRGSVDDSDATSSRGGL